MLKQANYCLLTQRRSNLIQNEVFHDNQHQKVSERDTLKIMADL